MPSHAEDIASQPDLTSLDKTTEARPRFFLTRFATPWALGWIAAATVVFSLGFVPLRVSHDEWWHLKTGKWIVEHRHLPKKDIFTYTAESYDWDNHEWLSQVIMYLAYRWGDERTIGGWRAVILGKTSILVATYLLLGLFMYRRAGEGARGHAIAIFFLFVAAAIGRRTFWPRPPVITYFFMVFYYFALWSHRTGRLRTPWLFVLPALMPLWANLHGGFILGNAIVGAFFAGEVGEWIIDRRIGRREAADLMPMALRAGIYLSLGILCGLASLLTPFGYKLYGLTSRVMRCKDLVYRISELQPPDLRYTWAYIFLVALIAMGLCFALVQSMRGVKKTWPSISDFLITGFFFWQSSHYMRHLPLFGLAAVPTAAWMLSRLWGSDSATPSFRPLKTLLVGAFAVCGAWLVFLPGEFLSVADYLSRSPEERTSYSLPPSNFGRNRMLFAGTEIEPGAYPDQAVQFLLSAHLPGRMFNRDYLAGYLIWYLSPEHHKVFTDQRFDIFGEDFLMDQIGLVRAAPRGAFIKPYNTPLPHWRDVIEKWRINWLFLEISEDINMILVQDDSGWALVYSDERYAVWLKRTPENQPWIDRYENKTRIGYLKEWLEGRYRDRTDK